jgi:hypothetical protein
LGGVLFLSSLFPFFLRKTLSEGLVDLGLKVASFTMGPLIGLFLLGKISFRPKVYGASLGMAIFLGILVTIFVYYQFQPALAYIIPIGMLSFYILLLLNQVFLSHKNEPR